MSWSSRKRAWHHLFFLPDGPGDNIGYICLSGHVMLTSGDFLKSGICVKAKWWSAEQGQTISGLWCNLEQGLDYFGSWPVRDLLCRSAPQSVLPKHEREPRINEWEIGLFPRLWAKLLWWRSSWDSCGGRGSVGWEWESCWAQQRQAGALRSCSPPSAQAELHVWGSGMVPESLACCSPWPLLNLLVGKWGRRQNEMLLESECVFVKICICIYTPMGKNKAWLWYDIDKCKYYVFGISHYESAGFTGGISKSTRGRKIKSREFPAQWSIFQLFPKGKCRTFPYNSGV